MSHDSPPLASPVHYAQQRHASTISSGPMSDYRLNNGNLVSSSSMRRNESTEHICMFSVCLMFIGVPIIVVGIIFLSFFPIFGVTLMVVGIVASSSGAMLAIISGILSIFAKSDPAVNTSSAGTEYLTGTPSGARSSRAQVYDSVHTIEVPQQRVFSNIADNNSNISDSQLWVNYSSAQNPKAYLDSFGDLPKVIPSPQPSINHSLDLGAQSTSRKRSSSKKRYHKKQRSLRAKFGGKLSKSQSRQQLTKCDGIEVMRSSSSSTSSSNISSPVRGESVTTSAAVAAKVELNPPVVDQSNGNNSSIVTIESCEVNIVYNNRDYDENDSEAAVIDTANDIIGDMKKHSGNYGSSDDFEKIAQQYADNNNESSANNDNNAGQSQPNLDSNGKVWQPLEETTI